MKIHTLAILIVTFLRKFNLSKPIVTDKSCCIVNDGNRKGDFLENFLKGPELGEGYFGVVFQVTSKQYPTCQYAVKRSNCINEGINDWVKENSIMVLLSQSRYFPTYYGSFKENYDENTPAYLFMNIIEGFTLAHWIETVRIIYIFIMIGPIYRR